jgi:hypothetical protein
MADILDDSTISQETELTDRALDAIDRKIIARLQQDGRQTPRQRSWLTI